MSTSRSSLSPSYLLFLFFFIVSLLLVIFQVSEVRLLMKEQVVGLLFQGLCYCRLFGSFLYDLGLNQAGLPSTWTVLPVVLGLVVLFSVTFSALTLFFSSSL